MSEDTSARALTLDEGREAIHAQARHLRDAPFLTMTTIAQLLELAISFGAAIYNQGDERGCHDLYDFTTRQLVDAAQRNPIGPLTDAVLDDLIRALHRAEACPDPKLSAWMLRHAFDKAIVTQQIESERIQWLVKLGEDAFLRGDYGGSADILRSANAIARELFAREVGESGIQTFHLAVLYYGHTMLVLEEDAIAHDALTSGVRAVPQLAQLDFDLRDLGQHFAMFLAQLERLDAIEEDTPEHTRAVFLRAYMLLFSGKRDRAREILTYHLGVMPGDEDAHRLLAMTAAPALD